MITHKLSFRSWIFCVLWIIYCGGCILWGNVFAKVHISLPWFPAPIFIGELLLFTGIFFTWPEIMNLSVRTKKIILVLSIVFFVATVTGFIQYGPLALRHAVIFMYVLIAFFLYQHVVKWPILIVIGFMLYAIFLPIRFGFPGNEFYAFSVWTLACFALSVTLKRMNIEKTKRLIYMAIFTLLSLPLYLMFHTSRTFIIANCVSFLCLFSGILMISRMAVAKKIMFSVFFMSILCSCVYFLADRNDLRSMVNIVEVENKIKLYDQEYKRLKKDFVLKDVSVSVFRPIDKVDAHIPAKETYLPVIDAASPLIAVDAHIPAKETYLPVIDAASPLIAKEVIKKAELRSYENSQQNFLFRVFVWKGLFEELFEKHAFLGFGLGKPLRPKTTQVLGWTERLYNIDGWISAHNSWFQLIYFFGILGVFIVLSIWFMWGHMFFRAVYNKDFWGIFLCSALCNFMIGTCSQPLLEQPHYAIFFWGLWGIVFREVYTY